MPRRKRPRKEVSITENSDEPEPEVDLRKCKKPAIMKGLSHIEEVEVEPLSYEADIPAASFSRFYRNKSNVSEKAEVGTTQTSATQAPCLEKVNPPSKSTSACSSSSSTTSGIMKRALEQLEFQPNLPHVAEPQSICEVTAEAGEAPQPQFKDAVPNTQKLDVSEKQKLRKMVAEEFQAVLLDVREVVNAILSGEDMESKKSPEKVAFNIEHDAGELRIMAVCDGDKAEEVITICFGDEHFNAASLNSNEVGKWCIEWFYKFVWKKSKEKEPQSAVMCSLQSQFDLKQGAWIQ